MPPFTGHDRLVQAGTVVGPWSSLACRPSGAGAYVETRGPYRWQVVGSIPTGWLLSL